MIFNSFNAYTNIKTQDPESMSPPLDNDLESKQSDQEKALARLDELTSRIQERAGFMRFHPMKNHGSRRRIILQQPSALKGKLIDHQLQSLGWMLQLASKELNAILADDMGLGKTIQTISYWGYLLSEFQVKGKHLLVCPKNVMMQWKQEINKWLPMVDAIVLHATENQRQQTLKTVIKPRKFDIVITSFQGITTALTTLKKIQWETFVMDEAHKIKNEESLLSRCARVFEARFKLLLTGTPLSNNLQQLWSLLYFILPSLFEDNQLFDQIEKNVNSLSGDDTSKLDERQKIAGKFHKIIEPFILRRTKAQLKMGLPPKTIKTIFAPLSKLQLSMYKNCLKYKNAYGPKHQISPNLHMDLRKICNHPYLFEGVAPEAEKQYGKDLIQCCGKMQVFHKLVTKLLSQNHKILIFSQFTTQLDIFEDYCHFIEEDYSRIDGNKSFDQRIQELKKFNTGQTNLFLLSTKAGGLGLNLVSADRVIIYDIDWNPQNDNQAMDRAYRIGQTKPVHVFKLITEYSVQERMLEVQKYKLIWDQLVIQNGLTKKKSHESLFGKLDFNEIAKKGRQDIFRLKQSFDDRTIDQLIEIGDQKDEKKNEEIRKKLQNAESTDEFNPFLEKVVDPTQEQLSFSGQQVTQSKQDDMEGSHKDSVSSVSMPRHKIVKDREKLEYLLTKKEAIILKDKSSTITGSEFSKEKQLQSLQKEIEMKKQEGFELWSPEEYKQFCEAHLKFSLKHSKDIAAMISTKTVEQVEAYSKAFFSVGLYDFKLREDHAKIQEKRELEEQGQEKALLKWKFRTGIKIPKRERQSKHEKQFQDLYNCIEKHAYRILDSGLAFSFDELKEQIRSCDEINQRKEFGNTFRCNLFLRYFWKFSISSLKKLFNEEKSQQQKLQESRNQKSENPSSTVSAGLKGNQKVRKSLRLEKKEVGGK